MQPSSLTDWLVSCLTDYHTVVLAYWLTCWLTDWLIDWFADWLADWQPAWKTDWLANWLMTDWLAGSLLTLTYWPTDWLTVLLADEWLAGWMTDWHSEWLTYWLTDWLTIWLASWLTDWLACWLTDWLADGLTDWPTFWMMTDGLFEMIMGRLVDCCWPGLWTGWPSDYWVPWGFFSLFSNNEMVEELITSTDVPIVTEWLMKINLYGPVEKNIILIS